MKTQSLRLRIFAFLAGVAIFGFSGWAGADPPSRVARLGYMTGAVSFSPAGDNDWVQATVNRPLTTGDRLWVDDGARAELQTGGALVRMDAGTSVSVLNLDDEIAQLQLTQGTLNVRVRRLAPNQVFEVDTPNLAFTLRQPGAYRIEVDPDGDATTIVVRQGQGEVYGEDAAYVIDSRQAYRFTGTGLREYEYVDTPRPDDFDRWSSRRDRSYDDSRSARYVSQDVIGYQDLDEYGSWRVDVTYGNVWFPSRVATGWAPYRDGHWVWIDPWGWTWVDDAPWGFAVSHYGRWVHLGGTWGWIPGPVRSRAYYAPALVVFVGGDNFQLTISSGLVGGVAWFPLGPREVYRPAYQVSRGYFENINRSNTVVNTTVINNHYNNTNVTNVVYVNRNVQGAVVAVPTTTFVQSQPVSRAAVRVSRETIGSAPLALVAPVAPTEKSVRGAAAQGGKPPPRVLERRVVARTAPPPAPVGFAAQQQQLTAKPGKPLDDAARKELKPAATAPAPVVKVVTQKQEAPPTVRPPPAAAGARAGDTRGKSEQQGRGEERGQPVAPQPETPKGAAQPQVTPPQATPAEPAAQSREPRGRSEQRGDDEQRGQTAAPRPPSPQRTAEPELAPPRATPAVPATPATPAIPATPGTPAAVPAVPATPAVPAAQTPEPRGKSEQRDERDERRERQQREQAVTPPPAPARGVAPPEVAPRQTTPEVPAAQSREPRDRSEQRGNGGQREREKAVAPPPAPPQRAAEPKVAPPPPAAQQPAQRAKPERAPAERQAEPRPPAAAPKRAPPPPESAPTAEPRAQEPKPAAGRARDKSKTSEEQEEEKREEQRRREERRN